MNNGRIALSQAIMNNIPPSLKELLQKAKSNPRFDQSQHKAMHLAEELGLSTLECAAALLLVYENKLLHNRKPSQANYSTVKTVTSKSPTESVPYASVKWVRYRLDVGMQQQVNVDELKKVLVEESGVDIRNIANVRIQDTFTLIELPDAMPAEIFRHLKTVEINSRPLDIRRVKQRNKRRNSKKQGRLPSLNHSV